MKCYYNSYQVGIDKDWQIRVLFNILVFAHFYSKLVVSFPSLRRCFRVVDVTELTFFLDLIHKILRNENSSLGLGNWYFTVFWVFIHRFLILFWLMA